MKAGAPVGGRMTQTRVGPSHPGPQVHCAAGGGIGVTVVGGVGTGVGTGAVAARIAVPSVR